MKNEYFDIIENASLGLNPYWNLEDTSIIIGHYTNMIEHENHYLNTIGVGNWNKPDFDEFRFNKDSYVLESCWLQIPQSNNKNISIELDSMLVKSSNGILKFNKNTKKVLKEESSLVVSYNHETDHLYGLYNIEESTKYDFALSITTDFELLFIADEISGWKLKRSSEHLLPKPVKTSHKNKIALATYLTFIQEENLDRLDQKDQNLHNEISAFINETESINDDVSYVISLATKNVLERFW